MARLVACPVAVIASVSNASSMSMLVRMGMPGSVIPAIHTPFRAAGNMIVVFGSINLDPDLPAAGACRSPGETMQPARWRIEPGGKGADQALAAARDGASVGIAGAGRARRAWRPAR